MSVSKTFSDRVTRHPRISSFDYGKKGPLVLAVNDQLLVSEPALPRVLDWLAAQKIAAAQLAAVFAGLDVPGDDVHVLKLKLSPKNDIVEVARGLRAEVGPGDVSPNHVLIPAMWGHSCPYGPPRPVIKIPKLALAARPFQPVTVIDSGYQWNPAWGQNPLDKLGPGAVTEREAEYIDLAGAWAPGIPDRPDVDNDHRLDALAGHANFIAGVIAQHCRHAQITVWNHNGGFAPRSDDFPTEAAVARSLVMSQQYTAAKVIDLGFAFTALDEDISSVWRVAFDTIGPEPIVVVPAGNQDSTSAYYPAALNDTFPGRFPNVIGVASVKPVPGGALARSSFSNYGRWVTCAARGEKITSTFLHVNMPVEDSLSTSMAPLDFTKTSWASWNGTSFSAPKVVAAITSRIALTGETPNEAWKALLVGRQPVPNLGIVFEF